MKKLIFILMGTAIVLGYGGHDNSLKPLHGKVENSVTDNVIKILNDYTISEGEEVNKDLKIIGGDLTVAGTVNGEITIIGGDVELLATAVINGRLTVLGGTLHKNSSAEVNGQIVELNEKKWAISREDEDGSTDEEKVEEEKPEPATRATPYSDDGWLRYNRQEGLYLQVNLFIQSSYINGATVYGGVGRSFHRNKYYGILGLEQLFKNGLFELYAEGYSRAATDDVWRISDDENSLAAFFIHEDFLDWYYTEGYTVGGFIHLPARLNAGVTFTDEEQSYMNTVVTWSMFGGKEEFREGYQIENGQDAHLDYHIEIGRAYRWEQDKSASAYLNYHRTKTVGDSFFDYTRDEFNLETFIPFTSDLGFHFSSHYGGIIGDHLGPQHMFYIGGLGSLRGYRWKEFSGNHYLLASAGLVFEHASVFYERGTTWDYSESTIDKDFIKKYQGHMGREAIGLSLGGEDVRIDIIKQVGKHRDNGITFNLIFTDI